MTRACPWLVAVCLVAAASSDAAVQPARIFGDNMVLQQDLPVAVWGRADPGEPVTVELAGKSVGTKAGADGAWRADLPPMKADGKPVTLTIKGPAGGLTFKNVLLGEVWLAGGQSNMGRSVKIQDRHPGMRLFWQTLGETGFAPRREDFAEKDQVGWCESSPEGLAATPPALVRGKPAPRTEYGEVAYVFGRKIHEELKVPVGLIWIAVGGSTASSWTPRPDIDREFPFDKPAEGASLPHRPGLMYQSRLRPVAPFTVRGAIWYQGEDDGRNTDYAGDFKRLIESWRQVWGRPDMPFYCVQIAQTGYANGMLGVWEAQRWVMDNVPHTGMAVSNDIYDNTNNKGFAQRDEPAMGWPIVGGGNPHPTGKPLVARRLADIALVKTYGGAERPLFGPMYDSHEIKGDKVLVKFKYAYGGLKTCDGKDLNWFEVSDGSRGNRRLSYVKAQARIVGPDTVEVWAPQVKEPKFVRFGWHTLARFNLINTDGLPAVSFRTDKDPL